MEHIKEIFDTSTIHGLSWISGTRRLSRLFWIFTVLIGFCSAIYLIYLSFHNWNEHPIATTIETLPISQMTLPNVTICPPKNSLLNLNYDIVHSDEFNVVNDTRNELFDYALDVIQDEFFHEMMKNLSKLNDSDRYHNWYHGYSFVKYPYYHQKYKQLRYIFYTSAASGNVSSQGFGKKFDADKVEENIYISIRVYVPSSATIDNSKTLMFNLHKNTIEEVSENDKMDMSSIGDIDPYTNHVSQMWNPPTTSAFFKLDRKVSVEAISNMDTMPGFRLSWNYNTHVEDWQKYVDSNKQFIR